jgi:hypothetical protein
VWRSEAEASGEATVAHDVGGDEVADSATRLHQVLRLAMSSGVYEELAVRVLKLLMTSCSILDAPRRRLQCSACALKTSNNLQFRLERKIARLAAVKVLSGARQHLYLH